MLLRLMGLPEGQESFKIGLVVLIQYRLWRTASHPASHPDRQTRCSFTLYASRRA